MSAVREATADRSGDLRNYALVTGAYWADTIADGAARVLVLFYFYERGYSPLALAAPVPALRDLRHRHEPRGRLVGRTARTEGHADDGARSPAHRPRLARTRPGGVAGGALRDGHAGPLGHRQGPDQDELQERGEARGAVRRSRRALPLGRGAHGLQERAQGRRVLRRRASCSRSSDSGPRCSFSWAWCWSRSSWSSRRCAATSACPIPRRGSGRCSRTIERSTCSPRPACCSSPPATSGS